MKTNLFIKALLVASSLLTSDWVLGQPTQPTAGEKWFASKDKNQDGRLSKLEAGDLPAFDQFDSNSNGFITLAEASRFARRQKRQRNESASPGKDTDQQIFPHDPRTIGAKQKLRESIARIDGRQKRPPNIVVILSDDLGYADLGLYGSKSIPTPNIDALGQNGVRFSNAYVTAASCSPSRAGLLSGRYQQRFGFEFNTAGAAITHRLHRGLDPAALTIAEVFQSAGYATGMFGKWHLGTQNHLHPQSRGFDEFYGFLAGAHSFLPAKTQEPIHTTIMRGHKPLTEKEYLTDAIARETVQFIQAKKDQPFFAYVPFNAVHTPIEATKKYQDRFPNETNKKQRDYNAMTSAMDDAVGSIVKAIDDSGLTENTVIVFLNDNGGPIYTGVQSNSPLKLGKLFLFEGGIRVPMVIKWPGVATANSVIEGTTSALDIFPTLCGAAGIELPDSIELDGTDLAPFIKGNSKKSPHEQLFWSNGPNIAVRKGDWKLVKSHENVWLFNLANDVGEKTNLATSHPRIIQELEKDYEQWRAKMSNPAWPSKSQRRKIKVDGMIYELNI